ncbi:MAG: UDP-3-O-(3-hydroxymyristoyl)glucosamine N-acyltransferase [Deltaproteobacteria bacterium]|nr:UDP-3-O-(3-hydroxymyristoyl)glucosamine N-acyltransferase [Deltaproteobacteria bacterium]
MTYTAATLAQQVGASVVGDANVKVVSLCTVHGLQPACVFPVLKGKYAFELEEGQVALTTPEIAKTGALGKRGTLLIHPVAMVALCRLIDIFFPEVPHEKGIHPRAWVDDAAVIHPSATVGPHAVVEKNVTVGEGSIIGPGAILRTNTVIGRFVRIGPGAVIGHDGFGYIPAKDAIMRVPQVGGVAIDDFVEIGANTCVDKGTVGNTTIGFGARLDNLVQVGHNVRIGRNVLIAAQVGIAGSCEVADHALIGGQAGIADHLTVGEGARVAAKSGVTRDVPAKSTVAGYPAMERWHWLRMLATQKRRMK